MSKRDKRMVQELTKQTVRTESHKRQRDEIAKAVQAAGGWIIPRPNISIVTIEAPAGSRLPSAFQTHGYNVRLTGPSRRLNGSAIVNTNTFEIALRSSI